MTTSAHMTAHITAASATAASVGGLIFNIVPPLLAAIASLGAILWYGVQLYETKTVQDWIAARRKPPH